MPLAPHPGKTGLPFNLCAAILISLACSTEAQALSLSQHLSWPTGAAEHTHQEPGPQPDAEPQPNMAPATATSWATLLAELDQAHGVREAQARAEASEAVSQQSQVRAWLPRLDASLRTDNQRQRYNGLASRTPSSASTLQATLPLWRPAERADARAEQAAAEQAQRQADLRRQSLARELSQTYLQAVEAAEHTRLTQTHLMALAQQALAVVRRTLREFVANGPTEKELTAAKQNIVGGFPMRIDSNRKIHDYLGMIGFYDLPLDYLETFVPQVQRLTVAEVKAAFTRRIDPERMVTVVVGTDAATAP